MKKLDKLLEQANALVAAKSMKNAKLILSRLNKYYADARKRERWSPADIDKYHSRDLERFVAACQAPEMTHFSVSIDWKKSRTWGWCPRAYVNIAGKQYTSYAGGCGYDKLSSAVASAMSESPSWHRFVFENCNKLQKANCYPFSWTYGLPSFSFAGCGMSCLSSMMKVCKWKNASWQNETCDKDGSLIGLHYSAK
jgi:hypothetical protein